MLKIPILRNLGITSKFILWFLVITLVPLATATYVSYSHSRNILKEEAVKHLFVVTDNKIDQIEACLREKKENMSQFLLIPNIIPTIKGLEEAFDRDGIDSSAYYAFDRQIRPFFTYYQNLFGYDDILIVSADGSVIFSAKNEEYPDSLYETALRDESELADIFVSTHETLSLETSISDFDYDPDSGRAFAFLATPVLDGGDLIGVIIARIDSEEISGLVQDHKNLGETGEVIMVTEIDERTALITPLRFDSSALSREEILTSLLKDVQIREILKGGGGSAVSTDYRNKEVLAIWKYLSFFRLGMIVKMDTAEIFASAEQLRETLSMTSLAILAIVILMAVLIARSVSRPIKELTRTSGIITAGNLSERARVDARDEIGELASSFNKMTDSLVKAKANVESQKGELEEQKKMLESVNWELDSFVHTVSHDLRAPLRAISSFSNFIEEDYKDKIDKEGREHLSEIRNGAKRMSMLIDDLLMLSRMSKIKNPYEDTDIKELINSILERIKLDIKEHKVDLRIQEKMPTISCDRVKIGEVFLNLINNAVKFSSKNKKERPRVEVGYAEKGDFHEFHVKDNGIGIDQKHHQEVFGIFRRLKTAQEFDGTGAGLSIVKRVVGDCGGSVWVKSELGHGATFYFTIPKGLKKKSITKTISLDGSIAEEETERGS